jgi:hypothetical protein
MKHILLLLIISLFILIYSGCKKDQAVQAKSTAENTQSYGAMPDFSKAISPGANSSFIAPERWFGGLAIASNPVSKRYADSQFVHDGVAYIPESNILWYYTGIEVLIPATRPLSADSIRIEARVNNNNSFSNIYTSWGRHSNLKIDAANDSIMCAMNDPERSDAITYCQFYYHGLLTTNIANFLFSQQDWYTLAMQMKDNKITVSKNGEQLYEVPYADGAQFNQLKDVIVYFYGSGKVDWVKLYNSYTNELRAEENFDVDGHSHIVWYN